MAQPTPVLVGDNSSTGRKIAVPSVAGAFSILVVIVLHVTHVPVSDADLAIGAPALAVITGAILDIVLPDRFLA